MSKKLENMTIVAVDVDKDHRFIRLTDDQGNHTWISAIDECCSDTWFEHVDMVNTPFKIIDSRLSTYDVDPEVLDDGKYTVTKRYALHLKTSAGHIDITLRNDSNGYYGGHVKIDSCPYGQYKKEEVIPEVGPIGDGF